MPTVDKNSLMKNIMNAATSTTQIITDAHKFDVAAHTYEGHTFTKDDLPKGCKDFLFDEKTGALKGFIPNDVETIEGTKSADYYYDLEGRILDNDGNPYSKVIPRRNDVIRYNKDGIPMAYRSSGIPAVYSDQGIAAVNEFITKLGMDKLLATDYTSDGIPMTHRIGSKQSVVENNDPPKKAYHAELSAVDMYKAELDENLDNNDSKECNLLE